MSNKKHDSDKKYDSHIDKPVVHITSSGAMYVRPFDIIRSKTGRAVIHRHASGTITNSNEESQTPSDGKNSAKKV